MKQIYAIVAVILTATLTILPGCTTTNKATTTKSYTSTSPYFEEVPVDNPIYLGFILLDEPTIETMKQVCEYHGLTPVEGSDSYITYRATNGTELRFKQSEDPTAGVNGNLIEIRTKDSQKTLDKIFNSLNYKKLESKSGQITYEHGSRQARNLLRATLSSTTPRTITFRSLSNTF